MGVLLPAGDWGFLYFLWIVVPIPIGKTHQPAIMRGMGLYGSSLQLQHLRLCWGLMKYLVLGLVSQLLRLLRRSLEGQNGSTPPSLSVWLGWTSIYHHFTSIYQLFWDFDPSPKMISSKHDVGRCRTLCSAQVDPSAITWIEYDRFWKTSMQKIYISKECLYYIILSYSTSKQKPHDFLVLWISTLNSTEKPLTSAVAYITVHFSGLLTVPLGNERSSTALAVAWAALSSTFQSVRGLWGFYFESWIAPNTTPCWNELELWKKRCPNHLVLYIKNDGGMGKKTLLIA